MFRDPSKFEDWQIVLCNNDDDTVNAFLEIVPIKFKEKKKEEEKRAKGYEDEEEDDNQDEDEDETEEITKKVRTSILKVSDNL